MRDAWVSKLLMEVIASTALIFAAEVVAGSLVRAAVDVIKGAGTIETEA